MAVRPDGHSQVRAKIISRKKFFLLFNFPITYFNKSNYRSFAFLNKCLECMFVSHQLEINCSIFLHLSHILLIWKFKAEIGHSKPFQSIKIQNFLQPWWRYLKKSKDEIGHSKPFQSFKIQNFLQPWWRYFENLKL